MALPGRQHSEHPVRRTCAIPSSCVIGLDVEGRVCSWSRDAEAVFGHTPERALGIPMCELAPCLNDPDSAPDGWCRRVDSSVFRALLSWQVRAPDNQPSRGPVARWLVVTDITARHVRQQAEARAQLQALQASEDKLAAICEETSDGILMLDATGSVISINAPALGLLRAANRPLLHVPWYHALGLSPAELPMGGCLETTCRRADGAFATLEGRVRTFGSGELRSSIIVLRDVTERRRVECQVLDAREQLQRQIGQDLHDGLGQLLTGTAFLTQGLQHSLASEHQPQVQRIVELINTAIARVRSLARGLSPIHVEAQSLQDMLRHTVREASELLGVACELEQQELAGGVPPATIAQLCLIVREAITNAVRHGHAQHIVVTLSRHGDGCALAIEDDGVGIGELVEGLGLRSMRHRAHMIGGELEVVRTRMGTRVRCAWCESCESRDGYPAKLEW